MYISENKTLEIHPTQFKKFLCKLMNTKTTTMKTLKTLTVLTLLIASSLAINAQCTVNFSYTKYFKTNQYRFKITQYPQPSTGVSVLWDFGTAITSTSRVNNLPHFQNTGDYNVCLTVERPSPYCKDSICKVITVCVDPDWDYSVNGRTVTFHNLVIDSNSNTNFIWDFGTGAASDTSHKESPSFTYTGLLDSFNVCLNVRNSAFNCNKQLCKTIFLDTANCKNSSQGITIINSSNNYNLKSKFTPSHGRVNYTWSYFNNLGEHNTFYNQNSSINQTFNRPGNYKVCVEIYDSTRLSQCAYQKHCRKVIVSNSANSCKANFTFQQSNDSVFFSNTSIASGQNPLFVWDFGDGNGSFQGPGLLDPMHVYANAGNYNVCLYINDTANNCRDTVCKNVSIVGPCSANFTFQIFNDSVIYSNTSTSGQNPMYVWKFGDGTGSNQTSLSHIYANPGNYQVCLYLNDTANNCRDTICKMVSIYAPSNACSASPTYNVLGGNLIQFNSFANSLSLAPYYVWDFGDGSPLSWAKNPKHLYSNRGEYSACVDVFDTLNNVYCGIKSCIKVEVATSLNENDQSKITFQLFPNPSNGIFNLNWETQGESGKVLVFNTNGAIVLSLEEFGSNSNEQIIDLTDFPDGMYLIQVHGNSNVESVRVIKSN